MISDETIERIKDMMDIREVVEGFVKLKRQGHEYVGLCPFHNERSGSFKVNPVKKIFKCFGCGKGGDAIEFIMEHEKLKYIPAIRWMAAKYNIEINDEHAKKEFVRPVQRLEKVSKKIIDYFEKERKISNNTLLRFGITESVEWMPQFEKETPVVCFNYLRDGQLINIKFRGPQKAFKMAKDAELIFYNVDAIKGEKKCIIVEGEVDALTLHECGFYNVVSVPNGAGKGKLRLEYMDNCWEYFLCMEEVIIATDNDEAGRILHAELARRIGIQKCRYVIFPPGCKDANEILVTHGPDAVKQVFSNALEWPLEHIVSWEEMEKEADEYYLEGYPEGCRAHIAGFDELLTFYPGQLTMVTGVPGSGKSEFVDLLMTSLTTFHNWKWGICSFETKPAFHITKLAEKFGEKAFDFRKNPNHRLSPQEWAMSKAKIKDNFHFINASLADITIDGLIKKAEELVVRKGINGLLFDPWNCIEHKYGSESETKYVLTCLNHLLHFLDKYQVHGFLVAHPTKLMKDRKTGKYPIPTLYDISGSAHFFNRTFNGFSVVRNYETNEVDVYVQKVKYSWLGKIGFCSFNYNTLTRQYQVLPSNEPDDGTAIDKQQLKKQISAWSGPVPGVSDLFSVSDPEDGDN